MTAPAILDLATRHRVAQSSRLADADREIADLLHTE